MTAQGSTTATRRFGRSRRTGHALLGAATMLLLAGLVHAVNGPAAACWALLALTGTALIVWRRARRWGTWTVTITPGGTLTSTFHSHQVHYTLHQAISLDDVIQARAGLMAVTIDDAAYSGRLLNREPLLALTTAAGDTVLMPPALLHGHPPLMAALRTHTVPNPHLSAALDASPVSQAGRALVAAV